jgi:hypothetical protein
MTTTERTEEINRLELLAQSFGDRAAANNEPEDESGRWSRASLAALAAADALR